MEVKKVPSAFITDTETARCCLSYTAFPVRCGRIKGYSIQEITGYCDIRAIMGPMKYHSGSTVVTLWQYQCVTMVLLQHCDNVIIYTLLYNLQIRDPKRKIHLRRSEDEMDSEQGHMPTEEGCSIRETGNTELRMSSGSAPSTNSLQI
ncbi:hypothetical protein C0J45_17614 [Silurus meridionalis]|nr:hypothetical protein C0J45_17614 [Silurus meridionalis]